MSNLSSGFWYTTLISEQGAGFYDISLQPPTVDGASACGANIA